MNDKLTFAIEPTNQPPQPTEKPERKWRCRGCGRQEATTTGRLPEYWSIIVTSDPSADRLRWRQVVCSPACAAHAAMKLEPWNEESERHEEALAYFARTDREKEAKE